MENLFLLCEKHFGTRDFYKIFHVKENATEEEGNIFMIYETRSNCSTTIFLKRLFFSAKFL